MIDSVLLSRGFVFDGARQKGLRIPPLISRHKPVENRGRGMYNPGLA